MLEPLARASLFPADRPVRTKERADVSTYYGEHAHVENCLVADGCFIEGTVTDCILFRGVRVARGAHLSRCIVMQDTCIAADAILQYGSRTALCAISLRPHRPGRHAHRLRGPADRDPQGQRALTRRTQ